MASTLLSPVCQTLGALGKYPLSWQDDSQVLQINAEKFQYSSKVYKYVKTLQDSLYTSRM